MKGNNKSSSGCSFANWGVGVAGRRSEGPQGTRLEAGQGQLWGASRDPAQSGGRGGSASEWGRGLGAAPGRERRERGGDRTQRCRSPAWRQRQLAESQVSGAAAGGARSQLASLAGRRDGPSPRVGFQWLGWPESSGPERCKTRP